MIERRSHQPSQLSSNADDYDTLFVFQVHRLIKLGYDRLQPQSYAHDQEPAITGDLVLAIDAVLDYPAEDWMRLYSPHDDPPENEPKRRGRQRRRGKKRKRVDIRVESSQTCPRSRFRFECKRLGPGHGAKRYLGAEGLGCFLRGDYASREVRAGMLGYVQCHDEQTWADKLKQLLVAEAAAHSVLPGSDWRHEPVIPELPHTYRSDHRRGRGKKPIEVYHTLLRFC
ncbi:MAG: hypothetical protein U1E05_26805 [Patescibacteria group bacterium]|nr:hypothetical protein [Patescibacteria group bacterium]